MQVHGEITHKHISDDIRKDSIEMGPAHARVKVYLDLTNAKAAEVLMLEAIHLSQKAAAELRTAGLLKDPSQSPAVNGTSAYTSDTSAGKDTPEVDRSPVSGATVPPAPNPASGDGRGDQQATESATKRTTESPGSGPGQTPKSPEAPYTPGPHNIPGIGTLKPSDPGWQPSCGAEVGDLRPYCSEAWGLPKPMWDILHAHKIEYPKEPSKRLEMLARFTPQQRGELLAAVRK